MEDTVDPTEYQKQVIYGAVLGDGRLERPKQGNSRLQIRHSIGQEPYVVYKHEILKPLSLNPLSHTYFDSRQGRGENTNKLDSTLSGTTTLQSCITSFTEGV
jgi:hypothetical protein